MANIGTGIIIDTGVIIDGTTPPWIVTPYVSPQNLYWNAVLSPFKPLVSVGGNEPMTYFIIDGSLPTGITLDPITGIVSGTAPPVTSSTSVTFGVQDIFGIVNPITSTVSFVITKGPLAGISTSLLLFQWSNPASGSSTWTDLSGHNRNGTIVGSPGYVVNSNGDAGLQFTANASGNQRVTIKSDYIGGTTIMVASLTGGAGTLATDVEQSTGSGFSVSLLTTTPAYPQTDPATGLPAIVGRVNIYSNPGGTASGAFNWGASTNKIAIYVFNMAYGTSPQGYPINLPTFYIAGTNTGALSGMLNQTPGASELYGAEASSTILSGYPSEYASWGQSYSPSSAASTNYMEINGTLYAILQYQTKLTGAALTQTISALQSYYNC